MAFARLFPIDAIDAQDGDRSEPSLRDGSCGSPAPQFNAAFSTPRSHRRSPIVRFRRVRNRILLERGTLPENVRGWGLSCGLVFAFRAACERWPGTPITLSASD